ncbi:TPA: hypothetical protein QEM79_005370 [Pseudomonas putida]|nr:hypothetical protein [Pseudomonas putida]HDS3807661.1 hypothetical protein [Pseudomonas putida]
MGLLDSVRGTALDLWSIAALMDALPLNGYGLAWLLPTAATAFLSWIIDARRDSRSPAALRQGR